MLRKGRALDDSQLRDDEQEKRYQVKSNKTNISEQEDRRKDLRRYQFSQPYDKKEGYGNQCRKKVAALELQELEIVANIIYDCEQECDRQQADTPSLNFGV